MVAMRIKSYLNDNGIKQIFVAEKSGIPYSRLTDTLNNNRKIDCIDYYKICKALNLPLEFFLKEEEE